MGLMPLGVLFILTMVFGPFFVCWYLALRLLARRMVLPVGLSSGEINRWCLAIAAIATLLAAGVFLIDRAPGVFALNAGMILCVAAAAVGLSWSQRRKATGQGRTAWEPIMWYVLIVGALGTAAGYFAEALLSGMFLDD